MTSLTLLRGVPASGKTGYAKQWVETDRESRIRVNRDDIRSMLFDCKQGLSHEQESMVTKVEKGMVETGLKEGKDVIVDAMHLRPKYITEWYKTANKFKLHDVNIREFPIGLEEALRRNDYRTWEDQVPEQAIQTMFQKYIRKGKFLPVKDFGTWVQEDFKVNSLDVVPDTPYGTEEDPLPTAVIVDIDGTLALNTGGRSHYDWDRVGEDTSNEPVLDLVRFLQWEDMHVIFFSGRDRVCYNDTKAWLKNRGLLVDQLHMRPEGDMRPDYVVKYEMYNEHIRGKYSVWFVLDDRNSVVSLFREIGLTVLQVADGDF